MATLETVEGIGVKYAKKLREVGVPTLNALLEKGERELQRDPASLEN